jgi:hypothetical protein
MKNVLHILVVFFGTGLMISALFEPKGAERNSQATLGCALIIMANQEQKK